MIQEECFNCIQDLHGSHDLCLRENISEQWNYEDEIRFMQYLRNLSFSNDVQERRIAARLLMEVVTFKEDATELLQRLTWDSDDLVRELAKQSILYLYQ